MTRNPGIPADIPITDLAPAERLALAACAIIVGTDYADLRSLSLKKLARVSDMRVAARKALTESQVKPRELRALGSCLAAGVAASELTKILEV